MACAPARPAQHLVRFYDRDDALSQVLVDFVVEGLRQHQQVVLLATASHWTAVERLLRARRVQVGRLLQRRQLVVIDAEEVLRQITADGIVNQERLRVLLFSILDPAQAPHRVFGELVSLLAARGSIDAVMELETLAAELASQSHVTVLCGYHLQHLGPGRDAIDRLAGCHDQASF